MGMNMLLQCLAALFASAFFGALLQQPKDTLVHTSLIGLNGYVLFLLLGQGTEAYFLSALAVGLLCEIAARIKERVTMIFLISATIPLVPGLALYRSMLYLAAADYNRALSTGVQTLTGFGAIALALTISTTVFANIRPSKTISAHERSPYAHPDLQ